MLVMADRGAKARRAAMREETSPYGGKSAGSKSKASSSSAVDSTNSTFELSTFLGHWDAVCSG